MRLLRFETFWLYAIAAVAVARVAKILWLVFYISERSLWGGDLPEVVALCVAVVFLIAPFFTVFTASRLLQAPISSPPYLWTRALASLVWGPVVTMAATFPVDGGCLLLGLGVLLVAGALISLCVRAIMYLGHRP